MRTSPCPHGQPCDGCYVVRHAALTPTALRVPCPGRPGSGTVAIARDGRRTGTSRAVATSFDTLGVGGFRPRSAERPPRGGDPHRVLGTRRTLCGPLGIQAQARHAFFSTCGSSLSVKSAMLSVAGPQEKLLVGRDAHKSVVSGLILSGIEPVWVDPQWDAERHLAHPPSAEAFEAAFAEHPDARGALVTTPTPYGTCSDLAAIAEVCHRRDRPLIVDEAWGAHLPFHPDLPTWAMDAGADVCVTSVHKMGSGLEQSSVFHLQGDLVQPEALKSREDLLGTTSPSSLVYAALDGWRRQMVEHGEALYDHALALAQKTRERIFQIDGMHVHGRDDFCGSGRAADMDPLQIIIDISAWEVTDYRAADWLRDKHRINLHIADHRRISAQLTHADDNDTAEVLLTALTDLAAHAAKLRTGQPVAVPPPDPPEAEVLRRRRSAAHLAAGSPGHRGDHRSCPRLRARTRPRGQGAGGVRVSVQQLPQRGTHRFSRLRPRTSRCGSGQPEHVLARLVIHPQRAGDGLEDQRGGAALAALFEAGVAVAVHAGQDGDLLPTQPRHPAGAVGGEPDVVRAQAGAASTQEVSEVVAGHLFRLSRPQLACRGAPYPGTIRPGSSFPRRPGW